MTHGSEEGDPHSALRALGSNPFGKGWVNTQNHARLFTRVERVRPGAVNASRFVLRRCPESAFRASCFGPYRSQPLEFRGSERNSSEDFAAGIGNALDRTDCAEQRAAGRADRLWIDVVGASENAGPAKKRNAANGAAMRAMSSILERPCSVIQ